MRSSAIKRAAALRELADLGCCKAKAAELMGVSRNLISRICREQSVSMPSGLIPCLKKQRSEIIIRMMREGKSRRSIAKAISVSRSRLSSVMSECGIKDLRGRSTITLRRACALREMASLGMGQTQSAFLLMIEPTRAWRICRDFGISMPDKRGRRESSVAERILRDFGKQGMTPTVMGERYQVPVGTVTSAMRRLRKEGKLPPVQERC